MTPVPSLRAIAAVAALVASGPAAAASAPRKIDTNNIAVRFLTLLNEGKYKDAFDLTGPTYIQHNPNFPDGKAATLAVFNQLPPSFKIKHEFKRVLVDGDLIAVHSRMTTGPGDRGTAFVDIMRIEHGKIVEHWDVAQPIPEKSANNNTMF